MKTKEVIENLKCCNGGSCAECTMDMKPGCTDELMIAAEKKLQAVHEDVGRCKKKIADLKKELAEREAAPGWISVEDRLPEKMGELCLVYRKSGDINLSVYFNHYWNYGDVTHWMPIPEPPKPKKKVKTYKDVFFEAFPNVPLAKEIDGIPAACRSLIFGKSNKCSMDPNCEDCWNQPYPEEEGEAE